MATPEVQNAGPDHYARIVAIYNHYIRTSPATFDTEPYSLGERAPWFSQFSTSGRYQLLVATVDAGVAGYAYSAPFKDRAAYDISVETTVYLDADFLGRGIGSILYAALLDRLTDRGLHGAYAGITLPNPASERLHEKLGFRRIGVETEVGRKFDRYWSVARYERRL